LEKFRLSFGGKPSLFEGKTIPPSAYKELKLQILAADRSGNFGQHILSFRLAP